MGNVADGAFRGAAMAVITFIAWISVDAWYWKLAIFLVLAIVFSVTYAGIELSLSRRKALRENHFSN